MRHVSITLVLVGAASASACLPGGRLPPEAPTRIGGELDARERGATQDSGPFRVVFAGPSGDELDHPQPQLVFSRPVRALSAPRDQPTLEARFTPAMSGRWEWIGTSAARFVPDARFDRSTTYSLEVAASIRALDGATLDAPVKLTFATRRPSLKWSSPASGDREVATDEVVRLSFTQVIPRAALERALRIVDGAGRDLPFELERDGAVWGEAVQLKPRGRWPEGARLTVRVLEGASGSEGALPMRAQEVTFDTRSHLHVTELGCSRLDDGRCAGDAVHVELSGDMRPSDLRALVSIRPAVKLRRASNDLPTSWHWLDGDFVPGVRYTVEVAAAKRPPRQPLPRRWGEEVERLRQLMMGATGELVFAPPDSGVELSFSGVYAPTRERPIAAKAEDALEATGGVVKLTRELAMRLAASRDEPRWWELPGATSIQLPVRAGPKVPPTWTELAPAEASSIGPVLFGARWRGPTGDARSAAQVLQASDLALHARVTPEGTLAWVTSLTSGAPLAGVALEARDASGAAVEGTTGADGTARLDTSRLGTEDEKRADEWRPPLPWMVLFAARGADWIHRRVEIPRAPAPRGVVFTDRGLYRPGDSVQLKGAILRPTSRGLEPVTAAEAIVEVRAPDGKATRTPARTTDWGSLDLAVPIDLAAPLGSYGVNVEHAGARIASGTFVVKEFRAASFRVDARLRAPAEPTRRAFVRGDDVVCDAHAAYFYGGSLEGAKVALTLSRQRASFSVPRLEGFTTDDAERKAPPSARAARTVALDATGRAELPWRLDGEDQSGPELVTCDAVVTDPSQELVGASASVLVHPARVYAALSIDGWSTYGGATLRPRVLAVTPEGAREAHRVRLELQSVDKDPKRKWGSLPARTVASCEVTTSKEPASCALRVPSGPPDGVHHFVVRAALVGAEFGASRRLYPGSPPKPILYKIHKPERPRPQAKLERDREEYRRGDVAHLTARSPFDAGQVLFTVEREGVLSHEVRPATKEPLAFDVPMDDATAPRAWATATFVAPLADRTVSKRMSSAMVELSAPFADRALHVAVRPSKALAAPGEELDVEVEVRTDDGEPARAEVTLYGADEATLSLAKYALPEPLAAFFGGRARAVSSSDSRDELAHFTDWQAELREFGSLGRIGTIGHGGGTGSGMGYGSGSGRLGGSHSGPEPRRNFAQGAFFLPHLETDADGRAHARVKLPDSLTEYRMMAFALTKRGEVGAGATPVTTQAPLQVRPSLPRVIRAGDRPTLAMLVANNGPSRLDARLVLDATGVRLTAGHERAVTLAPGESRRVVFEASAPVASSGKLLARVEAGALRDAAELPLAVTSPLAMETAALHGALTDGRVEERLGDLSSMRPDVGGLDVTLSSTPLTGLAAGLEQLVTYPHGCTEQTTSRLVPLLPLRELARDLGVALPSDLDAAVVRAVGRLLDNQREGGDFGMWPGSTTGSDWLSVYATWGLDLARRHGVAVDERSLGRARAHLLSMLARWGELSDGKVTAPYALDVLTDAVGQPHVDADSLAVVADQLVAARAGMPEFSRALLLHAMARLGAPRSQLDAQVTELAAGLHVDGAVARYAGRDESYTTHFDSQLRTSALVLRALLAASPRHPMLAPLALGLVRDRSRGTWRTTQEAAWALLALSDYAKTQQATTGVAATASLGGLDVLSRTLSPSGAPGSDARVSVSMAELLRSPDRSLVFGARGGTAHYEARLRFTRSSLPTDDVASGIELHRRTYTLPNQQPSGELLRSGGWRVDGDTFAEGATVMVELELITSSPRRFVVIEDPLPGGFESWDLDLQGGPRWLRRLERGASTRTERRDDRVVFFVDDLSPGVHRLSHLIRATRTGSYVTPPARAEEMYSPETFGRTAARTIVVR